MEVLLETSSCSGGVCSSSSEVSAVSQASLNNGELRSLAAICIDGGTLGLRDFLAVDVHGELVGLVLEGADELGGPLFSEGDETLSKDIELSAILQREDLGSFNLDFFLLTGSEGDEVG